MATLMISFVLLLTVVAAMAIGVICQNKPIKGSCGGIASLGMGRACDICGGDNKKCDEETKKKAGQGSGATLAYDATKQ